MEAEKTSKWLFYKNLAILASIIIFIAIILIFTAIIWIPFLIASSPLLITLFFLSKYTKVLKKK